MTNQDAQKTSHIEVYATEGLTQDQAAPHIEVINQLLAMSDDQLPGLNEAMELGRSGGESSSLKGFVVKSGEQSFVFNNDGSPAEVVQNKLGTTPKFDG